MKTILTITCLSVLALASPAEAKGCIKGAIVGGVAGHMAGHGKLGAAAGCVIGHHANVGISATRKRIAPSRGQYYAGATGSAVSSVRGKIVTTSQGGTSDDDYVC